MKIPENLEGAVVAASVGFAVLMIAVLMGLVARLA
jgi:hypothetical protein